MSLFLPPDLKADITQALLALPRIAIAFERVADNIERLTKLAEAETSEHSD